MKKETLEEKLFQFILSKREVATKEILQQDFGSSYTKQGLYKALVRLREEEKILWSKRGKVEVHLLWIQKEIDRLATALPNKELVFKRFTTTPVTYIAVNLTDLERLYGQIFISLISSFEGRVKNFFFYDIHNYTYVNTTMVVDWQIEYLIRGGGEVFLLVGSLSPLDLELKRTNKMKEIHTHCIVPKWSEGISVLGDYIISIKFHPTIRKRLDEIFATCTAEEARAPLELLYKQKLPCRIKVEKNVQKAELIKKTFNKYFILK